MNTLSLTPSLRSAVDPFLAMDVLRHANEMDVAGEDVIHMEVGQPAKPVPERVLKAAQEALATGRLGYTDALGIPPLRKRIAAHYHEKYGIDLNPDRVVVTTGSSGGFVLSFLAVFDAGDRVALPRPGYPAYRNILKALGLEVVEIETRAENRHVVTPDEILKYHAEKPLAGILLASPNNPTGTLMSPAAIKDVAETCDEAGIRFISDEIYHDLVYAGEEDTALRYSENTIVINSFSKYFCMTGWRVGWMVVPESFIRPVECIAQNVFISAPELSQRAGVVAFDARSDFEEIKAGYAKSREMLLERLPQIGLSDLFPADGAFYIYADVSNFTNDAMAFAAEGLKEAKTAFTPGLDFDPINGNRYVRFSFAGEFDRLSEGVSRIGEWLANR